MTDRWDPDMAEESFLAAVALLGELGLYDAEAADRFRGELFSAKVQGDGERHDAVSERLHAHASLLTRMGALTTLVADSVDRRDAYLLDAAVGRMRALAAEGFEDLKDGVQGVG